jgi:hypothetical protein
MYLGLCLIGVIAVVWAVTSAPTRPRATTAKPGPRDLERRLDMLRACPERVTTLDVDRLLRAHPLPGSTIARVLGTAAERRMSSRTLWSWADRFGADKLVLALDADVAETRMKRHLDAGTTPDWEAMVLFAGLNRSSAAGGMPFDEILDPDVVPVVDELQFDLSQWETDDAVGPTTDMDLSQFGHLPPIYNPGLPVTRTAAPPSDRQPGAPRAGGDDNGWPQVA